MKAKVKYQTCDYREAQEMFAKFKQKGTSYIIYDYPTSTYTIELEVSCDTEAERNRYILQQLYYNVESEEEKETIIYADSAIKTLVDMGVLK